jgi:predicted permease
MRIADGAVILLDRIRQLFRRGQLERELDEEMRIHLEMEIDERVRMGMTPGEARRTALRNFGGVERYKEEARAVRRLAWLEEAARLTRQSARSLRRSPAFTLTVVGLLALGIGAAASIYALLEATLLSPVPYPDPATLAVIWNRRTDEPGERVPISAPHLAEVIEGVDELRAVAFTNRVLDVTLGGVSAPAHARLGLVTPGFFDLLGVRMARGRGLLPSDMTGAVDDGRREMGDVVVLGHGVWRDLFGGDETLVGRTVLLEGRPFTVVGVLPRSFRIALPPDVGLPPSVDLWAPIAVELADYRRDDRLRDRDSDNTGLGLARLAPTVSVVAINERLAGVSRRLAENDPDYRHANLTLEATPLSMALTRRSRPLLRVLAAAGVLLLLAIWVSTAGLLLARHSSRRRELATRAALGAGRRRLFGELLVESLVLCVAGAAAGLALAWPSTRALRAMDVTGLVGLENVGLWPGAFLVTGAILIPLILVLAALPALEVVRSDLAARPLPDRLRAGGQLRARTFLVGAQVALAFLLLASGGLLVRRLQELRSAPLGFRPAQAHAFDLSLRYAGVLQGPAARALYINRLEDALRELLEVEEVGLVGRLPLSGRSWMQPYGPPGTGPEDWRGEANFRVVTSGFFAAAGTRLLAGRGFLPEEDLYEERRVVIVDRALARQLDAAGEAVGRRIAFPLDGAAITAQVVGEVEDVRFDDLAGPTRPTIYVPYRQEASREVSLVIRARDEQSVTVAAVRERVSGLGIPLAPYHVRPLEAYVRDRLAPNLLAFDLVALFALLTLLTSVAGVYGLAIYTAGLRRKEVAIRMAVGAAPQDILLEFLRWGGLIAAGGLAGGAALVLVARPLLAASVGGLRELDLAVAGGVALSLTLLVLSACALGGRAAIRARPAEALRLDG